MIIPKIIQLIIKKKWCANDTPCGYICDMESNKLIVQHSLVTGNDVFFYVFFQFLCASVEITADAKN